MSHINRNDILGIKDTSIDNNVMATIKKEVTDYMLANDIGYTFTISDKMLGHGSYGEVYLATDESGKQVAVKCCDIDKYGVPNILETSIMASIRHPYLNKALRIQATDSKLYIIQELAQTDLAQYTRREKGNHKPSISELRYWCFCLVQAVAALHAEDIIHADIKSNNILLYADGSIRLTDYTLATKQWNNESFTHNVCTPTHRPLECLTKRSWNKSLDIWSLACTFYEIAYGELLFNYQGALETDQKVKDKESKLRVRNRSINAIIDWELRGPKTMLGGPNDPLSRASLPVSGPLDQLSKASASLTLHPIDYIPFTLCSDYGKSEMATFNNLLCSMLIVDPALRPNINKVMTHPFFAEMKPPTYMTVKRPVNKIPLAEHARVIRYIQRYTNKYVPYKL